MSPSDGAGKMELVFNVARYFLNFLVEESCGKCTPCREGLKQMLHIYDQILAGRGRPGDLDRIERLAHGMQLGSLCELGKSAPNPVLSTLRYFRHEYEAHVGEKTCAAGVCRDLTMYRIALDPCTGCHLCFKACPTGAITGKAKLKHVIDPAKCIACGACYDGCGDDAVRFGPRTSDAGRLTSDV